MIRRDVQLAEGGPQWLLISQLEHARISGALAGACISRFGQSSGAGDLREVREEIMGAIAHHDAGWMAWEAAPRLDEQGRPPSFRELPLAESLPISTASIEAAAQGGDLAAWVVAGHFMALLDHSDRLTEVGPAAAWRDATSQRRARWLARWKSADPPLHNDNLAEEALRWLQLFDAVSLWVTSLCPIEGQQIAELPKSYTAGAGQALETTFACLAPSSGIGPYRATMEPWRLEGADLPIVATGWLVPVRKYGSTDELLDAMSPHEVRWLLCPQPS